MDQAYLISLVEGLYPFGKRSKTGIRKQEKLTHSGDVYGHSTGVVENLPAVAPNTGVARYLRDRPLESGVARYVKKNKSQPVTGVGKYLAQQSIKGRQVVHITGVSKYLARFDSAASASGVAKYVANQIIKTKYLPKRTTVGRYIARQEIADAKRAALTGVAKYQAEQDLLQRRIEARKLIERYREEESRIAAEKAAALAARQEEAVAEELLSADVSEVPAETGVARYFQQKAKIESRKPPISKVAKYIAQQVVRDSLKPRQSGVDKYLAKSRVYKPKPVVSGVSRYLQAQAQLAKTKPAFSGVAKYLIRQRITVASAPVRTSGVTRYLSKHVQAVSAVTANESAPHVFGMTGVAKYLNRRNETTGDSLGLASEPVLEGEFIPASEALASDATETETAKATRVSKYINENQYSAKKAARKPTGVERYIRQSA